MSDTPKTFDPTALPSPPPRQRKAAATPPAAPAEMAPQAAPQPIAPMMPPQNYTQGGFPGASMPQGFPQGGFPQPGFQQPGFPPANFPQGAFPQPHEVVGERPFYPGAFEPQAPANPLARFFRVPGMHIKLPSHGAYMPPGSVEFTATGELPVFPMRAADEILLKNPDSLMSGYAVEQLLASCVPAIKAPALVSMPDLDVLFLAIRAATFGPKMEFEVRCPKCEAEHNFEADLLALLTRITELPTECPVRLTDEVVAYLRPYNMRNATTVAVATFEETRRLQAVAEESEKVKAQTMTGSIQRITKLSEAMMADCVMQVATPDGVEQDPGRIREFMGNIPRDWTKRIEKALRDLNDGGLDKTITPTCETCGHTWETALEFDPASFFGQSS